MRLLPALLVAFRFVCGPLLFIDARDGEIGSWFALVFVSALLSDVFDGVIARRLGVATEKLRVADSWTDGWFCLWIFACLWMARRDTLLDFAPLLTLSFALDWLGLLAAFVKYRRVPAYHSYLTKAAGAMLFFAVMLLIFNHRVLVVPALCVAIAAHIERLLITLLLPRWTHDVSTVFKAWQLKNQEHNHGFLG